MILELNFYVLLILLTFYFPEVERFLRYLLQSPSNAEICIFSNLGNLFCKYVNLDNSSD